MVWLLLARDFYNKKKYKEVADLIVDCKFSLEEIKKLSKSMVILVDNREKENKHITEYFDKFKISYQKETLNYGDYSFYIPANAEYGIENPIYFHKEIIVERKNSLEELSGNLGKERDRFEKEFLKASNDGCKLYLLVENPLGYSAIMEHNYKTEFKPLPYVASLKSFENRYGLHIQFIDKQYAGYMIFSTFYYFMRENLSW